MTPADEVALALLAFDMAVEKEAEPVNLRSRIVGMTAALEAVRTGRVPHCAARQEGDEMACGRCGLRWDVTDLERPACRPATLRSVPTRRS